MSEFEEWWKQYRSESLTYIVDSQKNKLARILIFSKQHSESSWNHQKEKYEVREKKLIGALDDAVMFFKNTKNKNMDIDLDEWIEIFEKVLEEVKR